MSSFHWTKIAPALVLYVSIAGVWAFEVQFHAASTADVDRARLILFQEKMNPFSVSRDCLLVATVNDGTESPVASDPVQQQQQRLAGFGQIRPLDETFAELTSLYVFPAYRRQGIATRLISTLLQTHDASRRATTNGADATGTTQGVHVALLTLRPTVPLYEAHGFRVVSQHDLPPAMQLEFAAGAVVSVFLGNELVAMMRR